MNYLGRPSASNSWFGNQFIVPPASAPSYFPYAAAPPPPSVPLSQKTPEQLRYEEEQARARSQSEVGVSHSPGLDAGINSAPPEGPATIGPDGKYSSIGYDTKPTAAKVAALAAMPQTGLLGISLADPALSSPFGGRGQHSGLSMGPSSTPESQEAAKSYDQQFGAPGTVNGPESTPESREAMSSYDQQFGGHGAGAGSSSDGTVLCGALAYHGLISARLYALDCAYAWELDKRDPLVRRGYLFLARPLARLMGRSRLLSKILAPAILPWARALAGEGGPVGRLYLSVGVPLCRMVGRLV